MPANTSKILTGCSGHPLQSILKKKIFNINIGFPNFYRVVLLVNLDQKQSNNYWIFMIIAGTS